MENLTEFLKGFNLQEIISLITIIWIFTKNIRSDVKDLKTQVQNIDTRLTRFEGRFEERGYWESRDKKIGE